ncbi:cyclopropane fatty acid synthase [Tieghemostelium lacteum]|uniref:Cyclopropane fatty acid synthase n=1 Tax=Tieghemostelium lacteum TaxID=361077 RepID=A0A151ZCX8_TIELA|nr:cyclopropane fatty acid synthase [Tieghemostelium lacteum]|eukprot:KYQ91812.1 cyclopropane fatty acid synthase [Tieghemostelium lacteum]
MQSLVPSFISNSISSSFVNWAYNFLFKEYLTKTKYGCIQIEIDDKYYSQYSTVNSKPLVFGDINCHGDLQCKITIVNLYRFLFKIIFGGDIGFSETYILGDFDTSNLSLLIKIFILNRNELDELDSKWAFLKHKVDRILHLVHKNTIEGSKENIKAHYDLSNEMFQLFLDPTMSYSCAYFSTPQDTLEQAQLNKIRLLIDKANISSHHHILEIGTGWGALAIEAVKRTGCRVTTISISDAQVQLATERVKQAGLQDRITILNTDYRTLQGKFDRVISCEMLEAVGLENLGTYFNCIDNLLTNDGLVVIQFIATNDQRLPVYSKGCDYIQKYIFPGSFCPPITSIVNAVTDNTKLVLDNMENMGPHYALTLNSWKQNFLANREKIFNLGFDQQFIRMFLYYFAYCESAFETRSISLIQMVYSRPCNSNNLPFYLPRKTPDPTPAKPSSPPSPTLKSILPIQQETPTITNNI